MFVRLADRRDVEAWAELRASLWPDADLEAHRREIIAALASPSGRTVAFVALGDADVVCGFAEASERHEGVNGCDTSPVAFLEGIYVRPEHRRAGVGQALSLAVEAWGRARGLTELASDARVENLDGWRFHRAAGFDETERVVCFRKRL